MDTFNKELSFISKVFKEGENVWTEEIISKTATFKELSRTDRAQHKLHFSIIAIFEHFGATDGSEGVAKIDPDGVYDMTVKAINSLLVCNDTTFTEVDKKELLNDSGAIFDLGFWLLGEKIAPFFQKFNKKSKA